MFGPLGVGNSEEVLVWLDAEAPSKRFRKGTGGFDTRVYKVFEALQSLENQVFRLDERLSAAAYKHSTAHVLHQLGVIRSPETHPECKDLRDANEGARMKEAPNNANTIRAMASPKTM